MSKQGSYTSATWYAAEHRLVMEIILTPQEAALFGILARNHGRVVQHDSEISELWEPDDEPEGADNTMKVHLHNLREKLTPLKIETIECVGNRLLGNLTINWDVVE